MRSWITELCKNALRRSWRGGVLTAGKRLTPLPRNARKKIPRTSKQSEERMSRNILRTMSIGLVLVMVDSVTFAQTVEELQVRTMSIDTANEIPYGWVD